MTLSNNVDMQQKRGNRVNLPATALDGVLHITKDTKELFYGTGTGMEQIGHTDVIVFDDTTTSGVTMYADAVRPIADAGGRDGWYFKNDSTTGTEHIDTYPGLTLAQKIVAKKKINWYFHSGTLFPAKISELKCAYAIFTADAVAKPFLVVVTTTGKSHIYQASTALVAGKSYVYYIGTEAPPSDLYPALERVLLVKTNTAVPLDATEDIYLIGYHTASNEIQNEVKLQTYMLGFKTKKASQNYVLKTSTATAVTSSTTTFTQTTAATTWTINHNLGKYPSVTIVDTNGAVVDGTVTFTSANQITCEFSPAFAGKAYLN